ncbi:MAG: FAD-dependent monooxygenase [Gemmobacter sp.]
MTHDADILIAGGGLTGPTLALALARAGFRVTVIDARPAGPRTVRGFDGRAYSLAAASVRLLRALGVWDRIAGEAQPINGIRTTDGRPGEGVSPLHMAFDSAEIEEGPMGHLIEDRFVHAALVEAMAAAGVDTIAGDGVAAQAVAGGTVTVTLASGRRLAGGMLVGCDGRASGTAARAGIRRTGWDYGQTALVTAIAHDRPHGGIAHQVFLPGGPLAILPLPGNRSSIVWSEEAGLAATIAALPDDDFLAVLRPRVGDFLGPFRLAGARFTYPLSLSLATRWIAPRLALAGDAAHGVHPIAGQGLNLGLRDVAALAEVLGAARARGEDVGAPEVLARYERWRRFDTTALALGMDAVNRLFSNDNPVLRAARDLGMGAVSAMPGLRRAFIRQAAGLSGPLPELMR